MNFKVFISYSLLPKEFAALYAVSEEAAKRGITCYIPDRKWMPNNEIPAHISTQLKDADAVLVIASDQGVHYDWLNKELEAAIAFSKKNIVFLADQNVKIHKSWKPHLVYIDRNNSAHTISRITGKLEKMKLEKEQNKALTWLAVGGALFLLFLILSGKDK
ncbi:MAG: toll/interleukin-1 receptor domain-containing protein [bacterium]